MYQDIDTIGVQDEKIENEEWESNILHNEGEKQILVSLPFQYLFSTRDTRESKEWSREWECYDCPVSIGHTIDARYIEKRLDTPERNGSERPQQSPDDDREEIGRTYMCEVLCISILWIVFSKDF